LSVDDFGVVQERLTTAGGNAAAGTSREFRKPVAGMLAMGCCITAGSVHLVSQNGERARHFDTPNLSGIARTEPVTPTRRV
jgi:hypothetical protein